MYELQGFLKQIKLEENNTMEFKDDTMITMNPKSKKHEQPIIIQNAKHIRHHSLHSLKSKKESPTSKSLKKVKELKREK